MDLTRRDVLRIGATGAGCLVAGVPVAASDVVVNDVQARLNETRVARILRPGSAAELADLVRRAAREGRPLAVSGSRHAMGGQQFLRNERLLDLRGMDRILSLDAERGLVEAEAGITWPALLDGLAARQDLAPDRWTIVQKQTGTDRLTLGGALAANAHGRVLRGGPISEQVEFIRIVGPDGTLHLASRSENRDLFRHALGGYGLFGPIATVGLRLRRRVFLEREVAIQNATGLSEAFERRIRDGAEYGDWQYATDVGSGEVLRRGILSTYRPAPPGAVATVAPREFSAEDWSALYLLAHTDRRRAFETYARGYLSTSGQIYGSDDQQRVLYDENYHRPIDRALAPRPAGSEVLTEIDIPLTALEPFLEAARTAVIEDRMDLIYGVVRLISQDVDSALPWARGRFACVIFNLHVSHTRSGLAIARAHFRRLIDLGIAHGGTFYLTYHRWPTSTQYDAAHPALRAFLAKKREWDPQERFSSDWYRHLTRLLA